MKTIMKTIMYKEYGSADVLQLVEIDIPTPKENEVLIKIHSTTVTPLDWKFRSGEVFIARLMSGLFKPKNLTPYELQIGKLNARKKFYTLASVIKRLSGNLYSPGIYLATNFGHMKQVKIEAERLSQIKSELFENIHEN